MFTLFAKNIPILPKQSQNSTHSNLVNSLAKSSETQLHTMGSISFAWSRLASLLATPDTKATSFIQ